MDKNVLTATGQVCLLDFFFIKESTIAAEEERSQKTPEPGLDGEEGDVEGGGGSGGPKLTSDPEEQTTQYIDKVRVKPDIFFLL